VKFRFKAACGVLLVAVPLLTACKPTSEPSEPPQIIVRSKPVAAMVISKPARNTFVGRIYPDCEDVMQTPCVTIDEGTWRKVYSYDPYFATKIKEPKRVRGGFRLRF
jgi:hypothetical protein